MPNKMLIDASHPEETRVVVLRGNRIEEFDFESASRKPLRGNIYLAKVTRVEPSLQAAFIEYGGNRHGFLAFSEIHPDYYQIPVADRQALLEEEARHADEEDEEEEQRPRRTRSRNRRRDSNPQERRNRGGNDRITETAGVGSMEDGGAPATDHVSGDDDHAGHADAVLHHGDAALHDAGSHEAESHNAGSHDAEHATVATESDAAGLTNAAGHAPAAPPVPDFHAAYAHVADVQEAQSHAAEPHAADDAEPHVEPHVEESTGHFEAEPAEQSEHPLPASVVAEDDDEDEEDEEEEHVEQIGGDALEETPRRTPRPRRHYKIQEVIKRRQVLLVQVVKEERGNKGAALTTYLSLAGRYSVLMPNTARGGGISRKITDTGDRKRLKSIVQDLDVPEGMGIILRTAGASRTRPEVTRDFEYLLRMWENVRELTLRSSAPTLVYEEGSIIKRAIRDLYNKDIEEVVVAGDSAWQEARDFMRLIMPTHVRNVVPWREAQPIYVRSGVESQLDAMFSNHVTLRSGGYLVINQAEALVAIDVNSGRSTREHNIEDTALRTNLEAADEVARQLRLRDLAGLVVVDFIDMEENRNNRSVERRFKDALKSDRARIQVGRISHFGLLEMSRQRIRTGVLEGSTAPCPHCAGSGTVRSMSSVALHVLRVIEEALTKTGTHDLIVRTRTDVALYVLNEKRSHLRDIERRFGVHVSIEADDTLPPQVNHALERGEAATGTAEPFVPLAWEPEAEEVIELVEDAPVDEAEGADDADDSDSKGESAEGGDAREADGEDGQRRRRRRRRRRGGRGERDGAAPGLEDAHATDEFPVGGDAQAEGMNLGDAHGAGPKIIGEITGDVAGDFGHDGTEGTAGQAAGDGGHWARERDGVPVPFRASHEGGTADRAHDADAGAVAAMPLDHVPEAEPVAHATMEHYAHASLPVADAAPRDMEPLEPSEPLPEVRSDVPVSAATPGAEESIADSASVSAPEPPQASEEAPAAARPPRKSGEVVITEADPAQPKRGGWWSRAKATLGG